MHTTTTINPFSYLERNAENDPTGVFFETFDQRMTNAEALTLARQVAFEMRLLGVRPGDIVALDLPETLSMVFTEAVFHEGGSSTVLPRGYESDGSFAIPWIFSSPQTPTAPQVGATVVTVDAPFLRRVSQNPTGIEPREYESSAVSARIAFSSGTTGQPNAIAVPLSAIEFHAETAPTTWMVGEPALTFLPTSSPFGFYAFYLSVKHARPFWAVDAGDPQKIVELAVRSSATSLKASPAQIVGIVEVLERRGLTLPHVESVFCVGTAMPPALAARLRAVAGGCEVFSVYGSTEATLATARMYESDDPFDVGHLFGESRVQIVDDDDNELPEGEIGRIRHHHPHMVREYLGNPEASRAAFRGDWFYPGDLGSIRPDGGLTLAGRASEVLNAGGVKIDPVQLDLFAVAHPLVLDAASFAYETASGVSQIGIALVTEDGVDVQALVRALGGRFGTASPRLVVRIAEVPRNAMGKPLRRTLSESYRES